MRGNLQNFARIARRTPTAAEEKLWTHIRSDLALKKAHFRRQVIFKNYIADFCCHASRLIIEVDGATHSTDYEIWKDEKRTGDLHDAGYRVLRFTNDDVFTSIGSVIDTIYAALEKTPDVLGDREKVQRRRNKKSSLHENTPTPYPSPQGGGVKSVNTQPPSVPSPLEEEGQGGGKKDKNELSVKSSASSLPSPLEGEGQGGG